jgi:hypothetical protein
MPHECREAMDTSTLLVVFLLVTAATLASYALSHWSSVRGALGFGWAATSIGTTMLLAAAVIVVLTFVFRGPLWRPDLGTGHQLRESAETSDETSARRIAASPFSTTDAASTDQTSARAAGEPRRLRTDSSPASGADEEPAPKSGSTPTIDSTQAERSSLPRSQFRDAEPWAATQCVHNVTVGLSEFRWKIVNECDAPVAVSYAGGSILLPAQAQRAVTFDEQSVPAGASYVACYIASPTAMTLIGAPLEERSTPEWRDQFESARVNDSCLQRLPN